MVVSDRSCVDLPVAIDEIQQREQEDPDDVDEVPVQAGDFDRVYSPA